MDYTAAATGGISGASAGGTIGGPWGAAIGGVVGATAGLFGKKKKKGKVSSFDKRQKALNEQQHQAILGQGPLADLYNYNPEEANAVFDQNIANPAYRKFQEDVIPGITGQFRKEGLMNSSYVGDAISKLARDVQENLNSKRGEYLYNEQKDARTSKRNAVENLQNRNTFAYDKAAQNGRGFDINKVLGSITPQMIDQARDYFNPKSQAAAPAALP